MKNSYSYNLYTASKIGNITTQYFGDKFWAENILSSLKATIKVYFPSGSTKFQKNVTLIFDFDKVAIDEFSNEDIMEFRGQRENFGTDFRNKNFSNPFDYYFTLDRKLSTKQMSTIKQALMPGFRMSWYYNDTRVKSHSKYGIWDANREFSR